jgi:hypothetical protein
MRQLKPKIARITNRPQRERIAFLENAKANGALLISGHFRRADARAVFPDAPLIISLRHPVDRLLSHYLMYVRANYDAAKALTQEQIRGSWFLDFYRQHITRRALNNLMCRVICGKEESASALVALRTDYALAWDISATDAAAALLAKALGVKWQPRRIQAAEVAKEESDFLRGHRPESYASFLYPEVSQFLQDDNREDVELYRSFCELSGLPCGEERLLIS